MKSKNQHARPYFIPLRDLKRYRRLSDREVLRWLTDINAFLGKYLRPKSSLSK